MKNGAYDIARNSGYDGYQKALESMVPKFFDKKIGSRASANEQSAEELHKPKTKNLFLENV